MADAKYTLLNLWLSGLSNNQGFGNFTLNQSTDALEFIFQAREAATLTKLGYRLSSITGTTPTYRISLQGVDASGNPDGTIKGGGSPASKTFSPSALGQTAGNWYWITLDNGYACSRGERLAAVIDYSSGTIDGSNNAGFSYQNLFAQSWQSHYAITNDAGSRSRPAGFSILGYASNTTAYGYPVESTTQVNFDLNSTPDEYAIKFSVPAAWWDTYKIAGVRLLTLPEAGGTFKVQLYGGTDTTAANSTGATTETTVHATVTYDNDHAQNSGMLGFYDVLFTDTTLPTLYAGATYRIGVQPQGTQDNYLIYADVDAASDLDAWPLGQSCSASTRSDGGTNSWTDVTTRRIMAMLLLSDITEPAGGGPGSVVGVIGE